MPNLIPTNISIPAHLAGRIGKASALATQISGGIASGESVARISIKGSRFRIVDGDVETVLNIPELEVVIVGANPRLSKTWYSKAWDPNAEPTAPDCYSLNGVAPHSDSTNPQNDLCASCPHNAWGSKTGPQGQKLKACSDLKRLAVVSADDPTGPIYLLSVTPAALKGLNAFQKELAMRGIAPEIVKTKVGFDTDASFPKLTFGFGGFLDEATSEAVDRLFGTPEVLSVTGEAQEDIPAPAPVASKPRLVAPAPAPEPAAPARGFGATAAAAPAAPAEEPKAVTTKPKAAPKAAPAEEPAATGTTDLADEIANMLAMMAPDDDVS